MEVVLKKVGSDDNLAHAFTKGVDASSIARRVAVLMVELRGDRRRLTPALDNDASAEPQLEGE